MRGRGWMCAGLALALPTMTQAMPVLVDENFDSGLGAWQVAHYDPTVTAAVPTNDTPVAFGAAGEGIFGPNSGHNGTPSAGFSADIATYDGTKAVWLYRQFQVAPGTYTVTVDFDRYIYQQNPPDAFSTASRFYLLTNTLVDNPSWDNFEGPDPSTIGPNGSGFRSTRWNHQIPNFGNNGGLWEHVTLANRTITTDDGRIEIRLALFEQNWTAGQVTAGWDNLVITGVPEPTAVLLLAAGLPLLRRRRQA